MIVLFLQRCAGSALPVQQSPWGFARVGFEWRLRSRAVCGSRFGGRASARLEPLRDSRPRKSAGFGECRLKGRD